MKKLFAGALMFFAALSAHAGIVSADFRTEADLPNSGIGPLVHERLGATPGSGFELDRSDFVSNPSNWGGGEVWLDLDSSTNVLSLFSQDTWDFYTFRVTLRNITGATINGIELLSNNLTDTGLVPELSYTGDSVTIFYNSLTSSFNFTGGAATFALLIDAPAEVPEPQMVLLFGAGIALFGLARRRKNAHG